MAWVITLIHAYHTSNFNSCLHFQSFYFSKTSSERKIWCPKSQRLFHYKNAFHRIGHPFTDKDTTDSRPFYVHNDNSYTLYKGGQIWPLMDNFPPQIARPVVGVPLDFVGSSWLFWEILSQKSYSKTLRATEIKKVSKLALWSALWWPSNVVHGHGLYYITVTS